MQTIPSSIQCPTCGEPVKAKWKICPACETRLQPLQCPLCSEPVKPKWKRCPQCEALLVCPICNKRIPQDKNQCPDCCSGEAKVKQAPAIFQDSICGMELIFAPGGVFQMGDTLGQGTEAEMQPHEVQLDEFYICRCPVTQAQWGKLMEENPSRFQGADLPVEQVTWHACNVFAQRLAQVYHGKYTFRLPTEAEWEFAARSGGHDQLYAGSDTVDDVAWYENNSQGCTHAVGTKAPNDLSLYDMSGNVWEWCQDTFAEDAYQRHSRCNPLLADPGPDRVIRGGSWHLDAWSARCARRYSFPAEFFGAGLGFRLIMVKKGKEG